jgi:hypothetical protein
MSTVDHIGFEEFPIGHVGIGSLELNHFSNLFHLFVNERRVDIAPGVN